MQSRLATPVVAYLEELEVNLKQKIGVVPEDALSDAREHLQRELGSLRETSPESSDEEIFRRFVETYGAPADVAQQYEDQARPHRFKLPGFAPGWRICCATCGRSAPAASAGVTRVAAVSTHKYVLGWCRDCCWLRWMRLEKDLEEANLTRGLGTGRTADELRAVKHRPWVVVLSIVAGVLLLVSVVGFDQLAGLLVQDQAQVEAVVDD